MSARALMKQFNKDVTGTLDFTEFATWWLSVGRPTERGGWG